MTQLSAFVGHSFNKEDEPVVREFTDFLDRVKRMGIGFDWVHAEAAEPKVLSEKVKNLMEGKNLFIGICTNKEHAVASGNLRPALFGDTLKARKVDFEAKTSDWIIQEIGMAVGKKMDLILLIEKGLRKPGGLQGDWENIYFERAVISNSFGKLLDQIQTLLPKARPIESQTLSTEPLKEEPKISVSEAGISFPAPTDAWKQEEYERAMRLAILNGNEDYQKTLYKTFYEKPNISEAEKVSFEAYYLFAREIYGDKSEIENLKVLFKKHPGHPRIAVFLGTLHQLHKEFVAAAGFFEQAAHDEQIQHKKILRLADAAKVRAEDGIASQEIWLLKQVSGFQLSREDEDSLFAALIKIAEHEKNDEKYFAYTEALLARQIEDYDRHFSIARKYSDSGENELALFHYLRIPHARREEGTWNNIGVAYDRLDLDASAIGAFRTAERLGNTLAMGNMALSYVNAGFLEEAQAICDKAVKVSDYDKQVGHAIVRIGKMREEEEAKEKLALDRAKKRRDFRVRYGTACIAASVESINAQFQGPKCVLTISISGATFHAIGEYEEESNALSIANIFSYSAERPNYVRPKKRVQVTYSGVVTGRAISFSRATNEKGATPTLLGESTGKGLMIINAGNGGFSVYEKNAGETDNYYEMSAIQQ